LADANGSIYDYLIVNPGQGYDETVCVETESQGSGAEITTIVANGKITGLLIYNGGSGYTPTGEVEIVIKIQSSADASIFDNTKDENGNIGVITVK